MSTPSPRDVVETALLNACGDGRFGPDDEMAAAAVEDRKGMAELADYLMSELTDAGYSITEAFCKCGHRSGLHTELHRSCSVELGTWICPCEGYANG